MNIRAFLAAAIAALTGMVAATPAAAAPAPQERVVVRERITSPNGRVVVRERTTVSRNYNRPRYRYRTVCRTTYRYGERRRVCRRVRVRR